MFELTPFNHNPFRALEEFERNFWNSHVSDFQTDIKDTGASYELEADLPGFKKDNIQVNVEDGYLTIRAERHSEAEEKDKKGNYLRCERSYGSFTRRFDLTGINADGITAAYANGVLKLNLPKQEERKPETRRLEIE